MSGSEKGYESTSVFGPPGCGKTTAAARWIETAAEKYGPESVFVTSFTRAAAQELAGRKREDGSKALDGVNAGTLHAHCFHALDRPRIAERAIASVPKNWEIEESDAETGEITTREIMPWNHAYPHLALTSAKGVDVDDPFSEPGEAGGDPLMAEMQRYRAMRVPMRHWPTSEVQVFAERWNDWKAQHGLVDFTDLIEIGLEELPYAPGNPAIGFVDEAQDMTPLQMALIRSWATFMTHIVSYGDDDQILYAWAGCKPETMFDPAPDHMKVLSQSYRVPRKVHALAERWITQVAVRQPKVYRPRDAEGEAKRSPATWREPQALVRDAQERIANGQSVMFLASCGYMLRPLLDLLRAEGVPFHNPYRSKAPNWNPFRAATGMTPAEKLLAFLRHNERVSGADTRLWTYRELAAWVEPLEAKGVLLHGAKTAIKEAKTEAGLVGWEQLVGWFTEEALAALYDADPEWYARHTLEKFSKSLAYPLRVLDKIGPAGLQGEPQCIVGTIHSVKGGESDAVYVFPDISQAGYYDGWMGADRDSVIRLFYVALTRARESVIVCSPASYLAVEGLA